MNEQMRKNKISDILSNINSLKSRVDGTVFNDCGETITEIHLELLKLEIDLLNLSYEVTK